MRWSDLTTTPDDDAVAALRSSWKWRLQGEWSPLLFSVFGDVFLKSAGGICWLNTGTGELEKVAEDEDGFRSALAGEKVNEWFLPSLVEALHQSGKLPAMGECYTYAIYPVFADGKYEVNNIAVVPAKEHFTLSGDLHQQLANLADGQTVRLQVIP